MSVSCSIWHQTDRKIEAFKIFAVKIHPFTLPWKKTSIGPCCQALDLNLSILARERVTAQCVDWHSNQVHLSVSVTHSPHSLTITFTFPVAICTHSFSHKSTRQYVVYLLALSSKTQCQDPLVASHLINEWYRFWNDSQLAAPSSC